MRPVATTVLLFLGAAILLSAQTQEQRRLLLAPDSPEFTRPAPVVCVVRLETSKGNVDIEVTRAWAPIGADRFVNLVRHAYYDDNRFFRVAPVDGCNSASTAIPPSPRHGGRRRWLTTSSRNRTSAARSPSPLRSRTAGRRRFSSIFGITRRRTTRNRLRRSAGCWPASTHRRCQRRIPAKARAAFARANRIRTSTAGMRGCFVSSRGSITYARDDPHPEVSRRCLSLR